MYIIASPRPRKSLPKAEGAASLVLSRSADNLNEYLILIVNGMITVYPYVSTAQPPPTSDIGVQRSD